MRASSLIQPPGIISFGKERPPIVLDARPVTTVDEKTIWEIHPAKPFPQPFIEKVIFVDSGQPIPPERSLVAIGKRYLPGIPLVPRTPPLTPLALPGADLNQLLEVPPAAEVASPAEPEEIERFALQRVRARVDQLAKIIGLRPNEFRTGESVRFGPVVAHQIKTPPLGRVSFDPILWQIEAPGLEGVNSMAAVTCKLLTLAETFYQLYAALTKDQFIDEAREKFPRLSPFLTAEELLARISFYQDPQRLRLGALSLQGQLVAGRQALVQGLQEQFPSGALVLLADCVANFTTGQIPGVLDEKIRREVYQSTPFSFEGLETGMLETINQQLQEIMSHLSRDAEQIAGLGLGNVLEVHFAAIDRSLVFT